MQTFLYFVVISLAMHQQSHARSVNVQSSLPLIYTDRNFHRLILPGNDDRITGGEYAVDGQFPFMVVVHKLLGRGMVAQCGGTVLSKRWVLTAGHCVSYQPYKFLVVFGTISKSGIGYNFDDGPGVSMITTSAVLHPEYYQATNDVALLYMPHDIPFNRNIQPIRLAGYNEIRESYKDYTAFVIGWGKDRNDSQGTKVLKYVRLPVMNNDECKQYWSVDERNVCTAPKPGASACQGDSGGPLVIYKNRQMVQIGIVSYGSAYCPSNKPAVFTRVSAFAKWIKKVTGIRI